MENGYPPRYRRTCPCLIARLHSALQLDVEMLKLMVCLYDKSDKSVYVTRKFHDNLDPKSIITSAIIMFR